MLTPVIFKVTPDKRIKMVKSDLHALRNQQIWYHSNVGRSELKRQFFFLLTLYRAILKRFSVEFPYKFIEILEQINKCNENTFNLDSKYYTEIVIQMNNKLIINALCYLNTNINPFNSTYSEYLRILSVRKKLKPYELYIIGNHYLTHFIIYQPSTMLPV